MTSPAAAALLQRLGALAPALGWDDPDAAAGPGVVLAHLADLVRDRDDDRAAWLLLVAVAGAYPTAGDVRALRRGLARAEPGARLGAVLTAAAPVAIISRSDTVRVAPVSGVLVDVDFCARNGHNTGIQRVVRSTVPHWTGHDPEFVAWAPDGSGYRRLRPEQRDLVMSWRSGMPSVEVDTSGDELVVPVDAELVLSEVPGREHLAQLTAIAAASGTAVTAIGYDAIPIVSADSVSEEESDRFAHYLTVIKHAAAVSCISATTAEEFRGFVGALPSQGLTGPTVHALPLPEVAPAVAPAPSTSGALPLVLMVGSVEPRKNQEGLLSAARILWGAGVDFEVMFIGGGTSWFLRRLQSRIERLRREGRAVSLRTGVSDDEMSAAYRRARVVAFPSLQEGYGLPVAEALASGTPVVTTVYGSTAEIAAAGGCLTVDPRDDDALADALRRVITDDALHAQLVAAAAARPHTDWAGYASTLWTQLTGVR